MKLGPVQTFVHTVDTSPLVKSLPSHLEYLLSSLSTRYFVKMFEMSSKQTLTLHWLLDYWQNSSVKRADWELWPTSHLTADNPHSPLSPTDCWEEERRGASLSHRKLSHLRQRWPVLPSLPTSRSSDASQHHTDGDRDIKWTRRLLSWCVGTVQSAYPWYLVSVTGVSIVGWTGQFSVPAHTRSLPSPGTSFIVGSYKCGKSLPRGTEGVGIVSETFPCQAFLLTVT